MGGRGKGRRREQCIGGVGGGEGQEKGTVYWRGGGKGARLGRVEERGEIACFNHGHGMGIIATAYAGGVSGGGVV